VAKGLDPVAAKRAAQEAERAAEEAAKLAVRTTVKATLEDYLVQVLGLMGRDENGKASFDGRMRSAPEQLRTFEQHIYPEIGEEQIDALKRSRIVQVLDKIAKRPGQ
jgi:hypothetical protein